MESAYLNLEKFCVIGSCLKKDCRNVGFSLLLTQLRYLNFPELYRGTCRFTTSNL